MTLLPPRRPPPAAPLWRAPGPATPPGVSGALGVTGARLWLCTPGPGSRRRGRDAGRPGGPRRDPQHLLQPWVGRLFPMGETEAVWRCPADDPAAACGVAWGQAGARGPASASQEAPDSRGSPGFSSIAAPLSSEPPSPKTLSVLETIPGGLEALGGRRGQKGERTDRPRFGGDACQLWNASPSAQLFLFRGLSSSPPSSSSIFSLSVQLFYVFSDRCYLWKGDIFIPEYLFQNHWLCLSCGLFFFLPRRLFCDEENRALFSLGIFPPPFNTMAVPLNKGHPRLLPTRPLPSAPLTLKYEPFISREPRVPPITETHRKIRGCKAITPTFGLFLSRPYLVCVSWCLSMT